jgi:uncharacterized membrane protein YdjX (TVP38/TMEM64 family)
MAVDHPDVMKSAGAARMRLTERLVRSTLVLALLFGLIIIPFVLWGDAIEHWVDAPERRNVTTGVVMLVGGALLAADIVLPVPSSIVGVLLGSLLGVWTGTAVGAAGMTLGCVLGLLLGRLASATVVSRIVAAEDFERAAGWLERYGLVALVVCRAVPVLAEASIIAAGAARVPLTHAMVATGLANIGISFAYAAIGVSSSGPYGFLVAFACANALPAIAFIAMRCMKRGARFGS